MFKGDNKWVLVYVWSIWYHSEPSEVPYYYLVTDQDFLTQSTSYEPAVIN